MNTLLPSQKTNKELLSIGQAAKYLSVSIDTLRRWDKSGKIASIRLDGKNRFFSIKDLEKAKEENQKLKVSDVAEKLGVSASTVRRYEEKGMLSSQRNAQGERVYQQYELKKPVQPRQIIWPSFKIDYNWAKVGIFAIILLVITTSLSTLYIRDTISRNQSKIKATSQKVLGVKDSIGGFWNQLGSTLASPIKKGIEQYKTAITSITERIVERRIETEKRIVEIPSEEFLKLNANGTITGLVVTSANMASGSVSGGVGGIITDGSITAADILDGTITSAKLAAGVGGTPNDDSVTSAKIVDGAVTSSDIKDNTITTSDIAANTIITDNLAATLTFSDGDFLDLAAIVHDDTGLQGLRLPNAASASPSNPSSGEGYIAWDASGNQIIVYNGSAWTTVGGGSGSGTITGVTAGNGLTGGGTSGTVTLAISLTSSGTSGSSSSNSGLEVSSSGLTLLKGCTDNQILKYTDAGGWACADDNSGMGGSGNAFTTIDTPSGTDPTADTSTDTLQFLATGSNLTITGANDPESVTFDISESTLAGAGLAANGDALDVGSGTGISVAADAISVDQSTAFAWTGQQSWTKTITDTGSLVDINVTLGNDSNADTVSGITVDMTSAATGDADILYGINIGDITAQPTVTETAIYIGTGWEQAMNVGGTLLSLSELQILDSGIALSELTDSGTLTATTVDINGGAIDGVTIGASSAGAGTFSSVTSTGAIAANSASGITSNQASLVINASGAVDIQDNMTADSLTLDANTGTAITISGTSFTTDISFQNGETLDNDTNSQFNFKVNTDATVTILGSDSVNANTPLTISSSGTGALTLQPTGAGQVVITSSNTSASAVDINATGVVAGAAITLDTTDGGIVLTAAGATNGDITLSPTDDFSLNGTAGSIISIGTSNVTQTINIGLGTNVDVSITDPNWSISGAGAGSFTSVTSTGAIAANSASGITSNQSTLIINASGAVDIQDNVTVDTLTVDTGALAINTANGITSNQATLVVNASGTVNIQDTLDVDSTIQAGSSNITLTLATGYIDADAITLASSGTTGSSSSRSGLQTNSDGLTLLMGCADNQLLKWTDSGGWACADDTTSAGAGISTIQENDVTIEGAANVLDFLGADFTVTSSPAGEANVAIDYPNSGITRNSQGETITGGWTFNTAATTFTTAINANGGITVASGDLAVNSDSITSDGTTLTMKVNGALTGNIQIGAGGDGSSTPDLLVLDVKSDSDDPSGTNGAMYYNASTNKFRCYQNGAWTNCIGAGDSLTYYNSVLGADVSIAVANTWYDGPSLSLGAGTWLVIGQITVLRSTTTATTYSARISDGTNHYASSGDYRASVANNITTLTMATTITLLNTTTIYVQATANQTATIKAALVTNGVGNNATQITAIKIQSGADLAELYYSQDESIVPGDVVSIDSTTNAGVKKTSNAYDPQTLGIVSTRPGLLLGDGGITNFEGQPVFVALSGRVPVNVSTENGPINPGDLLTSSSIPGVAMKATKAGRTIGMAMGSFTGEGVGTVTAFVNSIYSHGARLASLLPGIVEDSINLPADFDKQILAQLITQKGSLSTASNVSEIFTDRLAAGLEVITPKVLADEIVADTIKANRIEGLEIFTDKISSLAAQLNDLKESTSAAELIDASPTPAPQIDMDILGRLNVAGGLKVNGQTEFNGGVIFNNSVTFALSPIFNSDTGGLAQIKAGSREVQITFSQEFANTPVVVATPLWDNAGTLEVMKQLGTYVLPQQGYIVTNVTSKGFTIILEQPAIVDLKFSWIALAVAEVKTFESIPMQTLSPSPTPIKSGPTPVPTEVPSPTPTQSGPTPSSTPEVSPKQTE
jgi:excisionase family DNA binding protein